MDLSALAEYLDQFEGATIRGVRTALLRVAIYGDGSARFFADACQPISGTLQERIERELAGPREIECGTYIDELSRLINERLLPPDSRWEWDDE